MGGWQFCVLGCGIVFCFRCPVPRAPCVWYTEDRVHDMGSDLAFGGEGKGIGCYTMAVVAIFHPHPSFGSSWGVVESVDQLTTRS